MQSLVLSALALAPAGCSGEDRRPHHGPGVALCVEMVEAQVDAARVVEITETPRLGEARIRFAPRPEGTDTGVATCRWEWTPTGGLRLAAFAIDGRALSELELLVRNADLLLQDLRTSGAPSGRRS